MGQTKSGKFKIFFLNPSLSSYFYIFKSLIPLTWCPLWWRLQLCWIPLQAFQVHGSAELRLATICWSHLLQENSFLKGNNNELDINNWTQSLIILTLIVFFRCVFLHGTSQNMWLFNQHTLLTGLIKSINRFNLCFNKFLVCSFIDCNCFSPYLSYFWKL